MPERESESLDEDYNPNIPPGCSFRRSKLEFDEDGRPVRTFYDVRGKVLHVVKGSRPYNETDIEISYTENPRLYARIYYRNIRRYRDGREPRKDDL